MVSLTGCKDDTSSNTTTEADGNGDSAGKKSTSTGKDGFGEKSTGVKSLFETNPDYFNTAMGITVPKDSRNIFIPLTEVVWLDGNYVCQDGSWEWIDASETTPQRGDIVVYSSTEFNGYPTHCSICVSSYDGNLYMNVDGNYGNEPGGIARGFSEKEMPNKGWPDSYTEAPGTEVGIGVWRSTNKDYADAMAWAAEEMNTEYKTIGQTAFLEKYIPELIYGAWCYYVIVIAVNTVAGS